jgi:predicted RND superfamily exporter protein
MDSWKKMRRTGISGQAATEFSIMLAMFMMVSVILLLLLSAFTGYGWRILSLVGLDYP